MKTIKIDISTRTFVIAAVILLILAVLSFIREVLILLFLSFMISAGLKPVINYLRNRWKVPKVLAITTIYLLFFLFIFVLFFLILNASIEQIEDLADDLPELIRNIISFLNSNIPATQEFLDSENISESVKNVIGLNGDSAITADNVSKFLAETLNFVSFSGLDIFSKVFNTVAGAIFSLLVVLISSIYFLFKEDDYYKSISIYLPKKYQSKANKIFKKVEEQIGRWAYGEFLIMLIIGSFSYILLMIPYWIGIESYDLFKYAVILAIISGLLEALPNIGPTITLIIIVIFALATGAALPIVIYLTIAFIALQQIEGVVAIPLIMKKAVDIDPILSIFGIIVGFELAGILGAIISIPFIVSLRIVIDEVLLNKDKE